MDIIFTCSDSDMEGRADKSKYEEKGVEDETGLRDIVVESDDEKEEEKKDDKKKKKEKGIIKCLSVLVCCYHTQRLVVDAIEIQTLHWLNSKLSK